MGEIFLVSLPVHRLNAFEQRELRDDTCEQSAFLHKNQASGRFAGGHDFLQFGSDPLLGYDLQPGGVPYYGGKSLLL